MPSGLTGCAQSRTLPAMIQLHATAVEIGGSALLLRGPSGSGKSDLALRLIETGARLISDDQVALRPAEGALIAMYPPAAPAHLAGCLEVRGLGIVRVAACGPAPLVLVVDLVAPEAIERLPEPETVLLAGRRLSSLKLAPFEASAPAKLRLALAMVLAKTNESSAAWAPGVPVP